MQLTTCNWYLDNSGRLHYSSWLNSASSHSCRLWILKSHKHCTDRTLDTALKNLKMSASNYGLYAIQEQILYYLSVIGYGCVYLSQSDALLQVAVDVMPIFSSHRVSNFPNGYKRGIAFSFLLQITVSATSTYSWKLCSAFTCTYSETYRWLWLHSI